LVATESGCIVTDTLGTPLDFAQGRRLERSTGIVCAPQRLHGALVDILARGG
jgi:3'-phosphoadenosine 5'-phosphosulfate (PAPS) 3'-phosphatase